MRFEGNELVLSSGRKVYAHGGILGIDGQLEITYGYDGSINWPPQDWHHEQLTTDDMIELSDAMIERWTRFKNGLKSNG